ncbi:hypothetical protein Tco_1175297 [Tanacetum coccineum]
MLLEFIMRFMNLDSVGDLVVLRVTRVPVGLEVLQDHLIFSWEFKVLRNIWFGQHEHNDLMRLSSAAHHTGLDFQPGHHLISRHFVIRFICFCRLEIVSAPRKKIQHVLEASVGLMCASESKLIAGLLLWESEG